MIARYQCKLGRRKVNAVGKLGTCYEVHSLFVDRNNKVLLAEHIDPRRPPPNTFVACSLAGTQQL